MFLIEYLYYFRNEKLQITLWGTLAKEFDEETIRSMIDPIIIALVSLSAKQYMGKSIFSYIKKNYIYIINLFNILTYY